MDVSIRVPLGHPLPEMAAFAARCEAAGFSGVGVPDHHHTGRDAYMAMAAMASRTERLRLFPATSNTVTRHPLVLASLINSLAEIAPGRAMLTVAPGFLSVEKAGTAPERRARLREVVLALRGLLGAGAAPFDGQQLRMDNAAEPPVQVVMLASGPRLLELAGEVADGVMMLVGLDPAGVEAARAHVRRGAERAGRDPRSLSETLIVPFGVGERERLRRYPQGWFREGKPWMEYPSASNLRWLRASGLELPDPFAPEAVSDGLADDILDAFGLFGSAEECADRLIRAREELGAERVFLFPDHTWDDHYEFPERHLDAFEQVIGPRLAG